MLLKKNYATGIDTSDVAAKKGFIALKAEVDKLDIQFPNGLDKSKLKVDYLDISKLETVATDLKERSDIIKNEIVKNTQ